MQIIVFVLVQTYRWGEIVLLDDDCHPSPPKWVLIWTPFSTTEPKWWRLSLAKSSGAKVYETIRFFSRRQFEKLALQRNDKFYYTTLKTKTNACGRFFRKIKTDTSQLHNIWLTFLMFAGHETCFLRLLSGALRVWKWGHCTAVSTSCCGSTDRLLAHLLHGHINDSTTTFLRLLLLCQCKVLWQV